MIHMDSIQQAARSLQPYLYPVPCVGVPWLDKYAKGPVYCKLENLQRTGSFKIRGATNCVLQLDPTARARGVVTASAGNHGLGVAQAASLLKCSVRVFVPLSASPLKVEKLESMGAELVSIGRDYDEAESAALEYARESELKYIHAFDDEAVIAGQGTIGLETIAERPDAGIIVVPVGGGGLLGGIGVAVKSVKPSIRVIGVQSQASPAMYNSLVADQVVETPIAETIADGLAGRFVSANTLALAREYSDEMLLVSEESICRAMREIYFRQGWRIEGSAAVGVAALLEGKIDAAGHECILIITGGNISATTFAGQVLPT